MTRMPVIYVPEHVENADAYIKAAQGRIRANAAKTARKRWIERAGVETVEKITDFLFQDGAYAPDKKSGTNPVVRASFGDFYDKMRDSLLDWNSLTDGQTNAVLRMIDRAGQRIEERAAAKAEKAATAKHIGSVGERRDFALTIKFTTSYETQFGWTTVHVMEDSDQNTVVYKGTKVLGEKGETITVKATIKAHDSRDGIAQTIISRPA